MRPAFEILVYGMKGQTNALALYYTLHNQGSYHLSRCKLQYQIVMKKNYNSCAEA